jgi:hypothetical protein
MRRIAISPRVWPEAAAEMIPEMMARTRRPSTSSMTAAPRMMRANGVRSMPASFSTRAVMPTLVAASMAPRNAWSIQESPGRISVPTPNPRAIGVTTPTRATRVARPPTAIISRGVDSKPTWKSRSIAPSSASTVNVSLAVSAEVSGPPNKARLPRTIPTPSSPNTAGCPKRSTTSPASLAAIRTKASVMRTVGTAWSP